MSVSANYKLIRLFRAKSPAEIAADTKISKQNLSAWENGKGNPGPEFIDQLSNYFGLPREVFYKQDLNMEYLENNFSDKKMEQNGNKTEKGMDMGDAIRKVVEDNTEYLIIPKVVLEGKYRLVPLEQIEKEAKELEDRSKQIQGLQEIIREIAARPINIQLPKVKNA